MNDGDSNFDAPPEESSNRTFLIAAGVLGGIVLLSIACLAGYALLILPRQTAANQQAATARAVQNQQVAQALTATSQALSVPTSTVNGTVQGVTESTDSSGNPTFTVVILKPDGSKQTVVLGAPDAAKLGLVTENPGGKFTINNVIGTGVVIPTAAVTPPPTQTPVIAQATATVIPATNTPDPATATVGAALTQAAQAQLTHVPTSTALPGTGIADQYGAPGLVILGMALIAVVFLARRLRTGSAR
jgi:hypothetical protein